MHLCNAKIMQNKSYQTQKAKPSTPFKSESQKMKAVKSMTKVGGVAGIITPFTTLNKLSLKSNEAASMQQERSRT